MGVRKRAAAGMRLASCMVAVMFGSLTGPADAALASGTGPAAGTARIWDFSDGTQGWVYDGSWAGESYTGDGSCSWDEEEKMLRVSLDYSGNTDNGWSQTGISLTADGGIDYAPYKVLSFDLYYDTGAFSTGQLTVKPYSDNIFTDQMSNINQAPAVDAGGGKKMVTLSMLCDTARTKQEKPRTLMLLLIGNNTDYCGDIWLDNIKLSNVREEKYLVEATVRPDTVTRLSATAKELVVNGAAILYPTEVTLVDEDADASVIDLYRYLWAVGESDSTLYGHMEDTVLKAGSGELSESDTKDVTGSLSAVVGFDCGNLFDGFASRYNSRNPGAGLPETNAGNIEAAARFSNEAIREGAVITLSAHVPNFAGVPKKEGVFENSYDGFDFLATDSYSLAGNAANQILPGGQYHDRLTAYLDMVADYARQVDGSVLFRPWHENTGSWFWWGKAFCDAETYKSIYKYTVEYLRDEKQVHNLLYLYGPGSEASTLAEYEERYPGDSYVDLVGFDTYDSNPVPDEEGYSFLKTFEEVVKLTDTFAKQHGKLFAVTETGISSESGGIPETGNRRPDWYREILEIITKPEYDCCYFMLWSNYSRTGSYYTPFVQEVRADGTLFGHELMDSFLRMYNHKNSIFAADQRELIGQPGGGRPEPASVARRTETEGYLTSPVAASRILEPQAVAARMSREPEEVRIKVSGNGREYWLDTAAKGKEALAWLDEETLSALGEAVDGRIALYSGEEKLQEIGVLFNIEPRPDDPYLVDDFESYGGVAGLLSGSWSTNKDSGCNLTLSLVKEFAYDGQYALQFDYQETRNGWAGCELMKEADWSGCNALQFFVVPDGKNQKTVVQINTSAGGSYEAYLQDYPDYARTTKPLLVTLPFEEFRDKNGAGKLTAAAASSISGIGFWVNAIPDSEAVDADGYVSGTLVYDAVRAGYTDEPKPTFEPVDFGGSGMEEGAKAAGGGADVSGEDGGGTGRSRMVMVISGVVSAASLICLLWLAIGMRKKRSVLCMVLSAVLALVSGGICFHTAAGLSVDPQMADPGMVGLAGKTAGTGLVRPAIAPPEGGEGAAHTGSDVQDEEEDEGQEDTRCIHEFQETWVGYECRLTDYNPDYFPGDEVKVTVTFGKKVGSQIGLNRQGDWYTVPGEGRKVETVVTPDNDYLNVQVTDFMGQPFVNLADIQVEITKKAKEDNTPYLHRFLGPWQGFETKFSDYNPDYAPGDEVKVSVRFKKEIGSQIGANIGGEWASLTGEGTELVQTFLPDNDYLNIQITDMMGNYTVGILSIDVEISEKGNGVLGGGGGGLMPTKYGEAGDYLLFSGDFNEGYGTNDGWLLECKATDWLTLTYDCGLDGQENWGVLGWGATVDGEWVDGPGYSAGSDQSTEEISLNFTVKYLRRMMGITTGSNLSYYSLGAWSGGRIVGLTLHVGSEIPRSDRLFADGAPNESWVCRDIEQILDEPGDRYLCVQYTCATPDYEGWTVLGWGASVDGEWLDGKSYKTSTKEATRSHFASMPVDAFRDMLHLGWDKKVDSIKLSAFNDGRILDLWLSDTKVEDPGNSKKDKIVAESPYSNPNNNIYGTVAGGGSGGSGGGGSSGGNGGGLGSRTTYEIEKELDEWGWNYPDSSIQEAVIRNIRKGTFLVVDYDTDGEKPPKLNFKTSQGTEAEVQPNWWKDGKAVYSYHAIASALNGYLIPNEISEIGIGAQGEPMTVYTIEVVKAPDAELAEEPIAVLKKSWEGFTTPVSKYNSSYQVGDTVTITVVFDKRCEAAIAFTLNGEWSAPYQKGNVISRTVRPESDSMTVSLGQMTESMRYVMVKDIQVEVAGKLNYDKAVIQEGERAALLACSTKDAAQAAGMTDAMVSGGTKLVIHTEEAALSSGELELAGQVMKETAGLEDAVLTDGGVTITLEFVDGDGGRSGLCEIPGPMRFKIPAPEGIDTEAYDFAVVRLHEGQAELLTDLDEEADTVTFASSLYSRFAVVYGPTGIFDVLTGETSLYTFRSAWSGYEAEIGVFLPEYEVGDEVKITAVFDRDTRSQIVVGGDWDHVTAAEGRTLTVTAAPKEDKMNIQIQDMMGERIVKLKSLAVEVTRKYDDGTGIHVFRGTWQGYETPLSSWMEADAPFRPGAETEVILVFDREVTAQAAFGVEGSSWYPLSGTGKEVALTVVPLEDKVNIQITDLRGNAAVRLTDIRVRQKEAEETVLYTFTQEQKEFEFDILEYCPDYQAGDRVRIVAKLRSEAYFNGRIGVNDVSGAWQEQYLESAGGEAALQVEWEIAPAADGEGKPACPGFQLWTVDSQAGVTLDRLTVERVGPEKEAVFAFTQTEKDFVFDILEYCPGYVAGDTVKITAEFYSDAYFNGRIGVNDKDGVWQEQYLESSGGEEALQVEWEITPAAYDEGKPAQPGFQLWTVNSRTGVFLDSLSVEIAAVEETPVFLFTQDEKEFAFNVLDYCPDYKAGDTVRIQAALSSDAYFNGRIGVNVQDEGWQQESFSYQDGTAGVEWVVIPDGEPSFGLWSIDSQTGVTLDWLTVELVEPDYELLASPSDAKLPYGSPDEILDEDNPDGLAEEEEEEDRNEPEEGSASSDLPGAAEDVPVWKDEEDAGTREEGAGEEDAGEEDAGKADDEKTDDGKTDDGKTDAGKTDAGKTDKEQPGDGKVDAVVPDGGENDDGSMGGIGSETTDDETADNKAAGDGTADNKAAGDGTADNKAAGDGTTNNEDTGDESTDEEVTDTKATDTKATDTKAIDTMATNDRLTNDSTAARDSQKADDGGAENCKAATGDAAGKSASGRMKG